VPELGEMAQHTFWLLALPDTTLATRIEDLRHCCSSHRNYLWHSLCCHTRDSSSLVFFLSKDKEGAEQLFANLTINYEKSTRESQGRPKIS
jgi:hypothetical protein